MANVPYAPYPTVAPEVEPAPRIGLTVPGAAFGTTVGQAIQGAGGEVSKVGDEFAQRALSFQALDNDTWAKNADTDSMEKLGKLKADFDELEGEKAKAALPKYQADIKQVREDALASAPNPMAKKLLQDSINRRVGFQLIDAGARAGQQSKVAANRASAARLEMAVSTFNGSSKEAADIGFKTQETEIRHQAQVHGDIDEDTINNDIRKYKDKSWLGWFSKDSFTHPDRAKDVFDRVKDSLDPQAREAAQKMINQGQATIQTRKDAATILEGVDPAATPRITEQDVVDKAREWAEEKGQDNPYYQDYLEHRVRAGYNALMQGYRDKQHDYLNTVEKFIQGQRATDPVVSIDGLQGKDAPEAIRNAFNALEPKTQDAIRNSLNRAAIHREPSEEGDNRFYQLWGQSSRDPKAFMDSVITNDPKMTWSQKNQLMARKKQLIDRQAPDSDINRYLHNARVQNVLKSVLAEATDPEERAKRSDQFTGALEWEVNAAKARGDRIDDKWLHATAQNLIQRVVTSPGYLWDTKERRFEVKIPDDWRKDITEGYRRAFGHEPDEAEIRAKYLAEKHFPTVQ